MTPLEETLADRFGRVADDLRVSITDRCNSRCTYCMPTAGVRWLPREQILRFEEIAHLVRVFGSLGIRSVKLTGGEPTVRTDLPELVRMIRDAEPDLDLSMTTNGLLLDTLAEELAEAGLGRVTVSLDSLVRRRFQDMTHRDALERVLRGISAADEAGLRPVKVNCVVIAGTNDDEVIAFAEWSRRTDHEVRFIEYMPLDAQQDWESAMVVPAASILERVDAVFPLRRAGSSGEPAARYLFADGTPGGISVISPVTEPFCAECSRLRITADGQLRSCLFASDPTDLRGPLRGGATDHQIATMIRDTVRRKWTGHRINHPDFRRPDRSISMIGG